MESEILSITEYLGVRSESWLYNQLANVKKHKVHIVAYNYINREEYPFSPVTILPNPNTITTKLLTLPLYLFERKPLDPGARAIISRIIKNEKIKLIQAHFGWMGYKFSELAKRFPIPFIVWLYGSDVFLYRHIYKLKYLFKLPVIFCLSSNALRKEVEFLGCSPQRIYVFHPGINIPSQPSQIIKNNQQLRIISIGRLINFKNPVGLVELAKILKSRKVDFIWEHFGEGEMRQIVEDKIKETGVGDKFFLRGEVSNQTVHKKLASADIMVHNAVIAPDGGRESFGVVLVEASAFGLPIVSVKLGGIPEIVKHQSTGFLLEPGDLEGMAEKIELLAKNQELRVQMGKAGYDYVARHFDLKRQSEKLDNFYEKLIASYPDLPKCPDDRTDE